MSEQNSASAPRQVTCPTCHKRVAWIDTELYRPFCSRKCQLIDFGDWATERHSIPADEPPDDIDTEDSGER